jgi:hypothetical protein
LPHSLQQVQLLLLLLLRFIFTAASRHCITLLLLLLLACSARFHNPKWTLQQLGRGCLSLIGMLALWLCQPQYSTFPKRGASSLGVWVSHVVISLKAHGPQQLLVYDLVAVLQQHG